MKEEIQQSIERLQLMLQEHRDRLAPFEKLHQDMKALFASTMMKMGPRQRAECQFALRVGEKEIQKTKTQMAEIEQIIERYVVLLKKHEETHDGHST